MSSRKEKRPTDSKKKKGGEDEQNENILQAVVLTDSYQTRFRPLTLETPRCLIPLNNIPLIDYTLEFLAFAGVDDVFIFAAAHAQKIEEYIRNSKWNKDSSPFKKCHIILSLSSMSVGDAMRELDGKEMIRTDFLLVNGDFVSNFPLEGVLEEHRKRRIQDKNAIMTMLLRESGGEHRSKARGERGIYVIDETTNRCVHYEEIRPHGDSALSLPPELLKGHPQLRIRTDLIDCHVDICSPDVPALFTENFDYGEIRRHFLHGILTDHELYGKTIHTHIITDHYAARVRSYQTYDAVSRDIMGRWAYPIVPDSNLGDDQNYSFYSSNIYKDEDIFLSKTCTIKRNTVIGSGTSIGDGSVVGNSVIGTNVTIGNNVVLDRAYVWDNVHIFDGVKIQNSIIASNCIIGTDAIVESGSIISYSVKIPASITVARSSKISTFRKREASEEDTAEALSGSDYSPSASESESEEAAATLDSLFYSHPDFALSASSISTVPGEDSDVESTSTGPTKTLHVRSDSAASEGADESWHKEASTSLLNAMKEGIPVEVASLELNGLRMASNASWNAVRRAVVSALVNRVDATSEQVGGVKKAVEVLINAWKALIKRGLHDPEDQVDFLLLVQRECVGRAKGDSFVLFLVQNLYESDLVEEGLVLNWWNDDRSSGDDEMVKVKGKSRPFVEWLQNASSEEENDDEEEEEENNDE